jgi:hypothetical protein
MCRHGVHGNYQVESLNEPGGLQDTSCVENSAEIIPPARVVRVELQAVERDPGEALAGSKLADIYGSPVVPGPGAPDHTDSKAMIARYDGRFDISLLR